MTSKRVDREALIEQAHTPTDDEREILTRIIHDETGEPEEESGFVADAILAAGFRRPVQGEPCGVLSTPEHNAWVQGWNAAVEAQGEPSDAQVLAALNAYYEPDRYPGQTLSDWSEGSTRAMRAALRAAFQEGESRG